MYVNTQPGLGKILKNANKNVDTTELETATLDLDSTHYHLCYMSLVRRPVLVVKIFLCIF